MTTETYDDGSTYTYDEDTGESSYTGSTNVNTGTGNTSQTFDDGSTLTVDSAGNVVGFTESTDAAGDSSGLGTTLSGLASKIGTTAFNALKSTFTKPDGSINWAALATAGAGLYATLNSGTKSGGYSKSVPKLTATQDQISYNDATRQPGSQGRNYFTGTNYGSATPSQGIATPYSPPNPYAGTMISKYNDAIPVPAPAPAPGGQVAANAATYPAVPDPTVTTMAEGGIANLAKGGRYLSGATDGMADKIPTSIDGKHPAALSHGEFVIPADVVSHLGNGNSEAGAKKLYEMMARIRKARTGNEHQGKQINANNFMPGGLAALAGGGEVMGFLGGGTIPAAAPAAAPPAAGGIAPDVSASSSLSPWVGDYVTTSLGEGAAASALPYQAYTGPLTAGASNLQQQAFAGSSEVAKAGFNPTQFTSGTFGSEQATQYMNPYLKNVLDPQMAEMKRQSDIARLSDAERLTKAGAYGGSRQAIMESEGRRNLLAKQTEALGTGYSNAYEKAMGQFNTEQNRGLDVQKANEESRKYSADFGLKSLADLSKQGEVQRGITSEGIAADKAQFEEQRDYGMKMPQYKLNLLQGLPIGTTTTSTDAGALANLQSQIAGLGSLYKTLSGLGVTPAPAPAPAAAPAPAPAPAAAP